MTIEKRYSFNPRYVIFNIVFTFAIIGIAVWMIIESLLLLINVPPLFFLLFFSAIGGLLYLQIKTTLVQWQHYQADKDKEIIISADRLALSLTQGQHRVSINSNDVTKVEIYEGKPWGRFSDFDYIVIYATNNQKIVITQFTVPLLVYDKALEKFLRKKPRAYFKKRFNFIDTI